MPRKSDLSLVASKQRAVSTARVIATCPRRMHSLSAGLCSRKDSALIGRRLKFVEAPPDELRAARLAVRPKFLARRRRPTYHRAVVKELGTVSALEEEGLSARNLGEVRPKTDNLSRRDKGREVSELGEDSRGREVAS